MPSTMVLKVAPPDICTLRAPLNMENVGGMLEWVWDANDRVGGERSLC